MNYRHAFHAGGFVDVMKHAILTRLIEYLKLKPAAFRVIDTHAGIGRYSLTGEEAKRSPEWMEGIGRLLKAELPETAKTLLQPYLDVVEGEPDKIDPAVLTAPNLLLTPHAAGRAPEQETDRIHVIRTNIENHIAGKPVISPVAEMGK